jgi:CheY-like chemotaxis protein
MLQERRIVALVEDNPDDRFLFERAWRGAGVKNLLRMFEDGQKALTYLLGAGEYADRDRHPLPGLLLLDIKMPTVSGFDVLRRLRQHDILRLLPVLMLTASTSPEDITEAYRWGANGFFIKPSSVQELMELLVSLKGCWLRFNEFPEFERAG